MLIRFAVFASLFAATWLAALPLDQDARADNWPQWRGPHFNGVAPDGEYPTQWGKEKNVAWKIDLPQASGSTPAVWGDHIFVSSTKDDRNVLLCFNRDGKRLWSTTLGAARAGKHQKGSGSNPSPTTDGQHVYAYFKSGDLACLDFSGKVLWQINVQDKYGEDTLWWDLGTSPVLTEDHVVVAVMHSGPSYLLALNKATGDVAWKQDRNLEAPSESSQSYSTPVVMDYQGKQILVVLGADHVTAHDAATGQELWRVGGLNPTGHEYFRSIASPVVAGDMVIAPYGRGATITAIRLGGEGDVTKTNVAWVKESIAPDVPTPAAQDGRVYVCTDGGEVLCLEAKTGKEIWKGQLEKNRNKYSSSPVLADGKIYLTREDGATFVLAQGDKFQQLAKNELDEYTVASPVFYDGKILIRTFESLFCISK